MAVVLYFLKQNSIEITKKCEYSRGCGRVDVYLIREKNLIFKGKFEK